MFLLIVVGCLILVGLFSGTEPEPVRDPEHDAKIEDYWRRKLARTNWLEPLYPEEELPPRGALARAFLDRARAARHARKQAGAQ
jgi:hypothetical protein